MVSNRVWGGVRVWNRSCVWNRWCRIVYGVGCEVVYVTGGVESCMGCDARSCMEQVVWNRV